MNNGDKPAYPVNDETLIEEIGHGLSEGEYRRTTYGLTKREVFAMAAIQGLLANGAFVQAMGHHNMDHTKIVTIAIGTANELLKQLESK